MPYTPPPGNQVGANFTATYTPPPGSQVGARFGSEPNTISTIGFVATAFGTTRISHYIQTVAASPITPLAFGLPVVFNYTRYILGVGFGTLSFGVAAVTNLSQGATVPGVNHLQFGYTVVSNALIVTFPVGFDSSSIGDHAISNFRNLISPLGFDPSEFGITWASNEIRQFGIEGFEAGSFGQAFISNAIQHVEPVGEAYTEFGDARVSRNIVIEPAGISDGAVGSPVVRDDSQDLFPPGLLATQFGQAFIRRAQDRIEPNGVPALDEFGDVDVYNLKQEVKVYWPVDYVAGPVPAPTISNYDREIRPFGFDALRIRDYHTVSQGQPPPVLTAGNTELFGVTSVTHYVRSIAPPGLSSFQDGRAVVYNAARALYPPGFEASTFGVAAVFNGLQFVDVINRSAIDAYGTPTISHAVRTVHAPSIFDTTYGTPTIGHTPQIVAPQGVYATTFGAAYAERRQAIVRAISFSPHTEYGVATIVNKNVALRTIGVTSTECGLPKIELYRRYLQPQGIAQLEFGAHGISHANRTIAPTAITGMFGLCWVHIEPQPPAPQTVYATGFDASAIPLHVVTANSIFPDGQTFTVFGTHKVSTNVIRPLGIFEDFTADTRPSLSSAQYVRLGEDSGGISAGIDSLLMGKPVMSPLTIWAPAGAPPQARLNHPPGLEYEIDEPEFGGEHPKFGLAEISNAIRYYTPDGVYATEFGQAVVMLSGAQYVFPEGKDTKKFGIPVLLGGTLTISPAGIYAAEVGEPSLSRFVGPYTQEISAGGLLSQSFGQAFVSTSPQGVFTAGEAEDEHGTQWISREYDPFPIPGFEATEFGDAWVSNYVRTVYPAGFDSFTEGEEDGYFDQRMRVSTRIGFGGVGGIESLSMGVPMVSLSMRIIQAFGPSTLSVPSPTIQMVIRTDGIDSGTLGSPAVDQIIPGYVLQHGWDSSIVGTPSIKAVISIAGIEGQVGTPHIAHLISGIGFESQEFGGPVVVGNGLACGSAVQGVMAGAMDTAAFGVATVA